MTAAEVTAAREELASAQTIGEVKVLRDRYEDDQSATAEIKLRAERRLGAMLKEIVVPRGNHGGVRGASRSLPEGITQKQSHQWQRMAAVPEDDFERWIFDCRASGVELTRSGLLRLWKELNAKPPASFPKLTDDGRHNHVCPACGVLVPCDEKGGAS